MVYFSSTSATLDEKGHVHVVHLDSDQTGPYSLADVSVVVDTAFALRKDEKRSASSCNL
jgi:hypothetical protein